MSTIGRGQEGGADHGRANLGQLGFRRVDVLHRLDLLDLRHLLHVLDLVQLLVLRLAFTCVDVQPAEELCILCPHLSSSAVLASHLWMHSCCAC